MGQALILAALIVAATIYSIYAITLNYTQTTTTPIQSETITEALIQALATASQTQNTTYATQLFEQYIKDTTQQNTSLRLNIHIWGQPQFNYSGYNQNLCVGCNVAAQAQLGPNTVNVTLTLLDENTTLREYTLNVKYTVNTQSLPLYGATAYTSTPSTITWSGNLLYIYTQTSGSFKLVVTTPWGLSLQCLL
ncbi:MAG: hypothetical protein QW453_06710 [Thermoprotei archaeon]